MKKVLSFLLSIVFLHVQTAPLFALRGGPVFTDQVNVDIVGTYSGTLIPDNAESIGTDADDGTTINALGLFSLGVPAVGQATGEFIIFTEGNLITGTVTAVGDPSNGDLKGLLEGTYDFLDATSTAVSQAARGRIDATVVQPNDFDPTDINSLLNSFLRISGEAQIGIIRNGAVGTTPDILRFSVDGVKQSSVVGTGATS
jgi:hypothetical protein